MVEARVKVVAIDRSKSGLMDWLSSIGYTEQGIEHVKPHSIYEVHAVVIYEGTLFYQIVDDLGTMTFVPSRIFQITTHELPNDWFLNTFNEEPSFIMGPRFIAESVDAYEAMVDWEPQQMCRFWERLKRRESERRGQLGLRLKMLVEALQPPLSPAQAGRILYHTDVDEHEIALRLLMGRIRHERLEVAPNELSEMLHLASELKVDASDWTSSGNDR
jgi:hypothetical protein